MLVSLYALGKVTGAEILLAGVLVCALLYLALCFLPRSSRTKRGAATVLLALLAAELVCDGAWMLLYFPHGDYQNHGIGGVYGAFFWPLALLVAGGIAAAVNHSRE